MIIIAPTALYKNVIPTSDLDPGDVTFTISSTDPPRTSRVTGIIPPAIRQRKWPEMDVDLERRRASLGELKYTISKSGPSIVGSNTKQFEVGQVLPFDDSVVASSLEPMFVTSNTELQHDTNLLDYAKLGLSTQDVDLLTATAREQTQVLNDQLSASKQDRANIEIQIIENKKLQNETTKAISAVAEVVNVDPALGVVAANLARKLEELRQQESELIVAANVAAATATDLLARIRRLSQVVR